MEERRTIGPRKHTKISSEISELDNNYIQTINDNRKVWFRNLEGMDTFYLIAEERVLQGQS